jgi:hypothetical protein
MRLKTRLLFSVLLVISCSFVLYGNDGNTIRSLVFINAVNDSSLSAGLARVQLSEEETTSRKTTALLFSCVVPGSGQTMFGHTYKGVAFSLTAFGSLLTAVISHNNFIAREERLDVLEYQYKNTASWVSADIIYRSMGDAHAQLKRDRDRRNIFITISAVVWTANILDLLYNTEDEGQTLFSVGGDGNMGLPALASGHQPLLSFSLPLK